MSEDGYDSKIPLHTEEAFQHGIQFDAKVNEPIDRLRCSMLEREILVYRIDGSGETGQSSWNRRFDASNSSEKIEPSTSEKNVSLLLLFVQYEFKAKSVKKRKVNISISVEGIKVSLWKKQKKDKFFDENRIVILQHPIYR